MELLTKKEPELKDLEGILSQFLLKGIGKPVWERTTRMWPNDHLIRRLISHLNQKPEATAPGVGRMTLNAIHRSSVLFLRSQALSVRSSGQSDSKRRMLAFMAPSHMVDSIPCISNNCKRATGGSAGLLMAQTLHYRGSRQQTVAVFVMPFLLAHRVLKLN